MQGIVNISMAHHPHLRIEKCVMKEIAAVARIDYSFAGWKELLNTDIKKEANRTESLFITRKQNDQVMNSREKIISIAALVILVGVPAMLLIVPKLHTLPVLLPLSIVIFIANAALLFVVFKDIFSRPFPSPGKRYLWVVLVFFLPPTILIYLPMHGFKPRQTRNG